MKKQYDNIIDEHYEKVALKHGLSPASTMEDEIVRKSETNIIVNFVAVALKAREAMNIPQPATIIDVGCGNGYTLETLSSHFPDQKYIGIEKSVKLMELAKSRFSDQNNVKIMENDIRNPGFIEKDSIDILICQRVIINLLAKEDQILALNNMVRAVAPPSAGRSGGKLIFIEAFVSPSANLNIARNEFDLSPIEPAYHNLYLDDDFFNHPNLRPLEDKENLLPPNFLSTHYFIARVLFPFLTREKPLKRNSEFVKFFSQALNQFVGDYSPLKLYMFEKV